MNRFHLLLVVWGLLAVGAGILGAQNGGTQWGIVVTIDWADGVSRGDLSHLVKAIPPAWRNSSHESARYEVSIQPNTIVLEECAYGTLDVLEGVVGTIIRRRIDAQIAIIDLGTGQQLASQFFQGETPGECPQSATFDEITGTTRYFTAIPDPAGFGQWLEARLTNQPGLISSHLRFTLGDDGAAMDYASYSPDGQNILTASSSNNTVWVWNAQTGEELLQLTGQRGFFSPDGQAIGTANWNEDVVGVWDARTGEGLFQITGEHGSYGPDGQTVLTGTWNESAVRVWNAETGEMLYQLNGQSAIPSPDGTTIVTLIRGSNTTWVWSAETGEELLQLPGEYSRYSPDGRTLVSGDLGGGTVHVWDVETGEAMWHLTGQFAIYSPDGRTIATTFPDRRTTWLWNAETGEELFELTGTFADYSAGVISSYSPDGHYLLTVRTGNMPVWDTQTGEELLQLTGQYGYYCPDGQTIITGNRNSDLIWVWDAENGEELLQFNGRYALCNPDGHTIATVLDGAVQVWDIPVFFDLP